MKQFLFKLLFFFFRKKEEQIVPLNPGKILVIRQDNRIGNLIFSTPFLALLKKRWPEARIDLMAGRLFSEVLSGNPCIDRIIVYNQIACARIPWKIFSLIFKLQKEKYDIVFDLKPLFSFNNMMMTVLSGAYYKAGFRNIISNNYFHHEADPLPANTYEPHNIASLLTFVMDIKPIPGILYIPPEKEIVIARKLLNDSGMEKQKPIGIHTGGRGNKKLPLSRFIELGHNLKEKGMPVVFFTGPDEREECDIIRKQGFICIVPERVCEFGGFLPNLSVFVSCDTGPMHMAAGAGLKTISIFLVTSVEQYAPKGDKNLILTINKDTNLTEQAIALVGELESL